MFTGRTGTFLLWDDLPLGEFNFENQFDNWSKMVSVSDYNGDGKSDIMKLEKSGIDNVFFKVYYSNGADFNETFIGTFQMQNGGFLSSFINERFFPFLDFNGDGKADLFSDNFSTFHLNLLDNSYEYLKMKEINNGLGLKTEIVYHPLTKTPFYTKGTGAFYPLTDIQPALHAVSRITTKDPSNNEHYTTYQYEGLKLHKQGKGLLGFMKTTTQSFVNNNQISQSQNVNALNDDVYYFLWPQSAKTFVVKDGGQLIELLSETTNQVSEVKPFGDKRHFYYIARSLTKEWDLNGFVRSRLSTRHYSPEDILYGNITTEDSYVSPQVMTLASPTTTYEFKTLNSFTYYQPVIQRWLISRLHEHESVMWEEEDGTSIQLKKTYTYRASSNLVKTITTLPDNQQNLSTVTNYMYDDNYGNIIYQRTQAPDADPPLPAMVTEYLFDPQYKHRFPTEEIVTADGIVYKTKYVYDASTGRLKKSTDPNNLSTFYYYDGFGRQVRTLFPDKLQQQSQVFWADGHEHQPEHALYYSWSQSSGMPPVLVFFDALGRELRQVSIGFEGEAVFTDIHYDPKGNIDRVSLPYRKGTQPVFSYYQYDELNRVKMVKLPDNTTAKTEYYPNSVKTINALEQTNQKYFNAAGWLVRSEDHAGKSVEYTYFSDGKLKTANIVGQPATKIELTYNARRQRLSLSDPNYGSTLTHYDAYDRLIEQISPIKEATTFTYDGLGHMASRNGPDGLTSWDYDIAPGRLGSLKSIVSETHQTTYTYDNLLRPTQVVDRIVDDEYTTNYNYDVYGRVKTTEYPTNYKLVSFYNEHGYFSHYREGGTNNKVWQALEMNALGQLNKFATGNGLQTTNTYYPGNARLHTVQTIAGQSTPIQDMEYGWDNLGNLDYRKKWLDFTNGIYLNESFGYDDLNRLETIHLNDKETGWHRYDEAGLGNMMEKTADNNYVFTNGAYDGSRPHALTSAHVNSTLRAYTSDDQIIEWTPFDQPAIIDQGTKRLEFTYGHHRQRIRQFYKDENGETTKTFAGNCEFVSIDGQQYAYTYLSSPAGLFGIHVKRPDGTSELFYIHTDHLGSLHTITDENGSLLQELSFDAWGNRRDPSTWTFFDKNAETALFDRGFTGHEHLDGFQLINMNGRLYDPVVSRMLSPDNYVQAPDFSQSFNRYSYSVNNPLRYTDPSGEFFGWDDAIVAGVGFAYGYISYGITNDDWGAKALASGAINAAMFEFGYVTMGGGLAAGGSINAAGNYLANTAVNIAASSVMPSYELFRNDNWSFSISPTMSLQGFGVGANVSYRNGDWGLSASASIAGHNGVPESRLSAGATYFDKRTNLGGSLGFTKYGMNDPQSNWFVGFRSGDFSISMTNDYFVSPGDKHRTAAAEIGIGDVSFGFNVYTTEHGKEVDNTWESPVNGPHKYGLGAYVVGSRIASPAYIGYRSKGLQYRFGVDHPWVQDRTQNWKHHGMKETPYFRTDYETPAKPYMFLSTYNPFSLY